MLTITLQQSAIAQSIDIHYKPVIEVQGHDKVSQHVLMSLNRKRLFL